MKHCKRLRRPSIVPLALALLLPPPVSAAPAGSDPSALAAFEAGFAEGQTKFDAGEYLAAARTWLAAAGNLPEKTSNRDNRIAVYEYIVDAFTRGLAGSSDPEALREAVTALDAYIDGFTRAYGTETPFSPKISAARDEFKGRLASAESATRPPAPVDDGPKSGPVDDAPGPQPTTRPWKGLAIGGGVMIGLGVGAAVLGAVGGSRGQSFERQFETDGCSLDMPSAACSDLLDQGKTMNTLGIAGAVAAPLLVGGGVALLVVGLKRRSQPRQALRPAFAPGFVGLTLRGSF